LPLILRNISPGVTFVLDAGLFGAMAFTTAFINSPFRARKKAGKLPAGLHHM